MRAPKEIEQPKAGMESPITEKKPIAFERTMFVIRAERKRVRKMIRAERRKNRIID